MLVNGEECELRSRFLNKEEDNMTLNFEKGHMENNQILRYEEPFMFHEAKKVVPSGSFQFDNSKLNELDIDEDILIEMKDFE